MWRLMSSCLRGKGWDQGAKWRREGGREEQEISKRQTTGTVAELIEVCTVLAGINRATQVEMKGHSWQQPGQSCQLNTHSEPSAPRPAA